MPKPESEPRVIATSATIEDLEKFIDQYGSDRLELGPGKTVLLHADPRGSDEPDRKTFRIMVGDDHAAIYWGERGWTDSPSMAKVFHDLDECQVELRWLQAVGGLRIHRFEADPDVPTSAEILERTAHAEGAIADSSGRGA